MRKNYLIFRQTKRSFSKKATRTISYIVRDKSEKAIFEKSPTFKEEQVSENVFLENSKGDKKSDLIFDISEGAPSKRKQIEKYINEKLKEKGIEEIDFSTIEGKERIIFKENLYTTSSAYQRDLFVLAENFLKNNPQWEKYFDAETLGKELINFTLTEIRDVHNDLFEYKNSFSICAVIHWDEIDMEKLMDKNNPVGAAHIHEVQIPFVLDEKFNEKNLSLDFDKILNDTIEKEAHLEELRKYMKDARNDIYRNSIDFDVMRIRLEELKQYGNDTRKKLVEKYGPYKLEKDSKGKPTGKLLKGNNTVLTFNTIQLSARTQERAFCEYEKTEEGKIILDKPIEPTGFYQKDDNSGSSRFYLNHLQERIFQNMQERGKEKPERTVDENGKISYSLNGKPITQQQALIIHLARSRYKELERGERSLDADLNYTKRKDRIEMAKFREEKIIEESKSKSKQYEQEIQTIERKRDNAISTLEQVVQNIPQVTGRDRETDLETIIDNMPNITNGDKKELKKGIKRDIKGNIKSVSGDIVDIIIEEKERLTQDNEKLSRSIEARGNIDRNIRGTLESRIEMNQNIDLINFIKRHPELEKQLEKLRQQEVEMQERDFEKKRNEQEKQPKFRERDF